MGKGRGWREWKERVRGKGWKGRVGREALPQTKIFHYTTAANCATTRGVVHN